MLFLILEVCPFLSFHHQATYITFDRTDLVQTFLKLQSRVTDEDMPLIFPPIGLGPASLIKVHGLASYEENQEIFCAPLKSSQQGQINLNSWS